MLSAEKADFAVATPYLTCEAGLRAVSLKDLESIVSLNLCRTGGYVLLRGMLHRYLAAASCMHRPQKESAEISHRKFSATSTQVSCAKTFCKQECVCVCARAWDLLEPAPATPPWDPPWEPAWEPPHPAGTFLEHCDLPHRLLRPFPKPSFLVSCPWAGRAGPAAEAAARASVYN